MVVVAMVVEVVRAGGRHRHIGGGRHTIVGRPSGRGREWVVQVVRCHAPNTFGTVNMECTVDSRLSWSER